jgi:hypothetical protein
MCVGDTNGKTPLVGVLQWMGFFGGITLSKEHSALPAEII